MEDSQIVAQRLAACNPIRVKNLLSSDRTECYCALPQLSCLFSLISNACALGDDSVFSNVPLYTLYQRQRCVYVVSCRIGEMASIWKYAIVRCFVVFCGFASFWRLAGCLPFSSKR